MHETLTISILAKRSGVSSKTIRYWESLGLLPRAARTHTGYRVFAPESLRYVAFIRRSKSLGLTLAEMREILRLTRDGRCPCSEVMKWTAARAQTLEAQVRELSSVLRRLKSIQRQWSKESCAKTKCNEVCCNLVCELPEAKSFSGGKHASDVGERCCNTGKKQCRSMLPGLPARMPALLPGRVIRADSQK